MRDDIHTPTAQELENLLRQDLADRPPDLNRDGKILPLVQLHQEKTRERSPYSGESSFRRFCEKNRNLFPPEAAPRQPKKWPTNIAAAIVCCVICLSAFVMPNARSSECDRFQLSANYLYDTIEFSGYAPAHTRQELQEKMAQLCTIDVPEGFTCAETLSGYQYDGYHKYYDDDDNLSFIISCVNLSGRFRRTYCKSGGAPEVYHWRGNTVYLFCNWHQAIAIWFEDGLECSISGTMSIEELKCLLDTIEEDAL